MIVCSHMPVHLLPLEVEFWRSPWRLRRFRGLGNSTQEVAVRVVARLRRIFGVLRPEFCRRLPKIVPDLILLRKVHLDLVLVVDFLRVELGPGVTAHELVILPRLVVLMTLGIKHLFSPSGRRHRDGVCGGFWKMIISRVRK